MKAPHIPSVSLLRHLATLINKPVAARHRRSIRPELTRCFSSCDRRYAASYPLSQRYPRRVNQISNKFRGDGARDLNAYASVYDSKYVHQDLREQLRLPQHASAVIVGSYLSGLARGYSPTKMADWYRGIGKGEDERTFPEILRDDVKASGCSHLADPAIISQALYLLSYHFILSARDGHRELGDLMFKTAVDLANVSATVAVITSTYHRQIPTEPSPFAYKTLATMVEEGNLSLAAMCLRAEMLMWPKRNDVIPTAAQRDEAQRLALRAFETSQAGPPLPDHVPIPTDRPISTVPPVPFTPPWKILERMANSGRKHSPDEHHSMWKMAITAGARAYDDPGACAEMISPPNPLVRIGSSEWVRLATKAAMAGKGSASFYLGQFYLELHGWLPVQRNARTRTGEMTGFQWIEVSLQHTTSASEIQKRAFLMALLLREHGDANAGKRWLERGAERIKELREMGNADERDLSEAAAFFESCIRDWHLPIQQLPPDWKVEVLYPEPLLERDLSPNAMAREV